MARLRPCSSVAERYLGKVKVAGSIPAAGSRNPKQTEAIKLELQSLRMVIQGGEQEYGKGDI